MSTDEQDKAVRDKRPWTEGSMTVEKVDAIWYVVADTNPIASFQSEADARLFAAAGGMYEILQRHYEVGERGLIAYSRGQLLRLHEETEDILRAANPSAFGEGD